jgi:hypothetical protein
VRIHGAPRHCYFARRVRGLADVRRPSVSSAACDHVGWPERPSSDRRVPGTTRRRRDGLRRDEARQGDDRPIPEENVKTSDYLTDAEVQSGQWLDQYQLDPGTYYVMVEASPDFDSCYLYGSGGAYDPACANGFSDIVTLTVPRPATTYSGSATALRYAGKVYLQLRARPLGAAVSYRVCWKDAKRRQHCLSAKIDGYSWHSDATDEVSVTTRGLAPMTTFVWTVSGKPVATKVVRTPQP